MKICVLVKEVPDAAVEKRINPATGRMDRSGEKNLNSYGTHAIEAAMQIREGDAIQVDEIVAVTMGPRVRRSRAPQGALPGRRPLGSSARRNARRLRRRGDRLRVGEGPREGAARPGAARPAVRRGDCYTIGAVIAGYLRMPSLTQVIKMAADGNALRCERQAEYGYDTVQVELPAAIAVGDAINEPCYPPLKATMGAKKKPLATVTSGDVGIDASLVGEGGRASSAAASTAAISRTRRRRPPARSSRTRTRTRRSRRSSLGSMKGS